MHVALFERDSIEAGTMEEKNKNKKKKITDLIRVGWLVFYRI